MMASVEPTSIDAYAVVAIVGVLATCVGALIWIIKYIFQHLTPAIDNLKNATSANTKATRSADKYLKERNGRDGEIHKELFNKIDIQNEALVKLPGLIEAIATKAAAHNLKAYAEIKAEADAKLIETLANIPIQHVEQQNIDKATVVENKVKEKK